MNTEPHRFLSCGIALACLPLLIVVWLVSPFVLIAFKAFGRWGKLPKSQTVDLLGTELTFSWTCKTQSDSVMAIDSAISLFIALTAHGELGLEVTSLRFLNPETGMALPKTSLSKITADFGQQAASLLFGNHVEGGCIELNGKHLFENLTIDARSPLTGYFSVEYSFDLDQDAFQALAAEHGFTLVPATASS